MKKIIIVSLLQAVSILASDNEYINRTGWHFGLGIGYHDKLYLKNSEVNAIPLLGLSFEYGLSPQLSLGLEYKGIILGGLTALQMKYYLSDENNSLFFTGGIEHAYNAPDSFDSEVGAKLGIGYAWKHLEIEISGHQGRDVSGDGVLRYKF